MLLISIYTFILNQLEDVLWASLTDSHIKTPMGVTAENLAEKYKITREDCDKFALRSQTRWKEGKNIKYYTVYVSCSGSNIKKK